MNAKAINYTSIWTKIFTPAQIAYYIKLYAQHGMAINYPNGSIRLYFRNTVIAVDSPLASGNAYATFSRR